MTSNEPLQAEEHKTAAVSDVLGPRTEAHHHHARSGGGTVAVLLLFVILGVVAVWVAAMSGFRLEAAKDWLGGDKPLVEVKSDSAGSRAQLNLPNVVRDERTPARTGAAPSAVSQPRQQVKEAAIAREEPPPTPAALPPVLTHFDPSRFSQTLDVRARGHSYLEFRVEGVSDLEFTFHAAGGDGNDIQTLLTDAAGLNNLARGEPLKRWYDSGKATTGSFAVRLNPGLYYIVFNNRFSLLTPKRVAVEGRLTPVGNSGY